QALAAWLAQAPGAALRLLCHPEAELDLAGALARHAAHDDICLLVGPEGGWSDEELEQARAAGVQAVRFGPRVLRTETAGIALIAAVSAIRGWNG
ncbi:RsmE family RNA methyltransferase, partial [Bordetella pertussis]